MKESLCSYLLTVFFLLLLPLAPAMVPGSSAASTFGTTALQLPVQALLVGFHGLGSVAELHHHKELSRRPKRERQRPEWEGVLDLNQLDKGGNSCI